MKRHEPFGRARSASTARRWLGASLVLASAGCGSSSGGDPSPRLELATASGAPLHATAGDAVALKIVEVDASGAIRDLPPTATVTWTSPAVVTALTPGDDTAPSPLPAFGDQPSAVWIANPSRPDRSADLADVLFILDPGTAQNGAVVVTATVSGGDVSGDVSGSILVDPAPAGDWTRGAALYGAASANCAQCHGASGHGSDGAPEATSYVLAGNTYDFPAPGLNAEPGNAAGDPAWNAALFAVAARADVDNGGVALRFPMPDWLARSDGATAQLLTTQDFADIFAFLKTQTQ